MYDPALKAWRAVGSDERDERPAARLVARYRLDDVVHALAVAPERVQDEHEVVRP